MDLCNNSKAPGILKIMSRSGDAYERGASARFGAVCGDARGMVWVMHIPVVSVESHVIDSLRCT